MLWEGNQEQRTESAALEEAFFFFFAEEATVGSGQKIRICQVRQALGFTDLMGRRFSVGYSSRD